MSCRQLLYGGVRLVHFLSNFILLFISNYRTPPFNALYSSLCLFAYISLNDAKYAKIIAKETVETFAN